MDLINLRQEASDQRSIHEYNEAFSEEFNSIRCNTVSCYSGLIEPLWKTDFMDY